MDNDYPGGRLSLRGARFAADLRQFTLKQERGRQCVYEHSKCSLPAEGGKHESRVPSPLRGHHENWGCCKRRQCPANRDINEKYAESDVFEARRNIPGIVAL